jgi:hypothetical protein
LRDDQSFADFQSGVGNWPSDKLIEQSIVGINLATALLLRKCPHAACDLLGRMMQYVNVYERRHGLRMCQLYIQSICHLLNEFQACNTASIRQRDLEIALDFLNSVAEGELGWATEVLTMEGEQPVASVQMATAIVKLAQLRSHLVCSRYYLSVGALESGQGELLLAQDVFNGGVTPMGGLDKSEVSIADMLFRNLFAVPVSIEPNDDGLGANAYKIISMHQVWLILSCIMGLLLPLRYHVCRHMLSSCKKTIRSLLP